MEKKICQRPIFSVSILSICFLASVIFSGYYEVSEIDTFSPNLCLEDQDLDTLISIEKAKFQSSISCFQSPLLPDCKSFQILAFFYQSSLGKQINLPIRC